jgi:hypothetical protein
VNGRRFEMTAAVHRGYGAAAEVAVAARRTTHAGVAAGFMRRRIARARVDSYGEIVDGSAEATVAIGDMKA